MRKVFCVLILLVFVFLAGCCSGHPVVEEAMKDAISVNKGHMADKSLPPEAALVAQDNYDLIWKLLYGLCGTPLPADVAKRMEERKGETE